VNLSAGALRRINDFLSGHIDEPVVESLQTDSDTLILHGFTTPALRA
jgi:hypothetical protein